MVPGRRTRAALVLLVPVLALSGCGGNSAQPYAPLTGAAAAKQYWSLTLAPQAITLSTVLPHDTITIVATPRDANGAPLAGLGAATLTTSDLTRLQIGANGQLHAIQSGDGIQLTATLSVGNVTHSVATFVNITNDSVPQTLASLSVQPLPPDSTRWAVGGDPSSLSISGNGQASSVPLKLIFAQAQDTQGASFDDIAIAYGSTDSAVANVVGFGGTLALLSPQTVGRMSIVATATAYGVSLADTVPFAITMPFYSVIQIQSQPLTPGGAPVPVFIQSNVTVSPGATVFWTNISGTPVDVTFDDPSHVQAYGGTSCAAAGVIDVGGTGNIAAFGVPQVDSLPLDVGNCRTRSFPVAGVYTYRSTLTGATGRITVNDGLGSSSPPAHRVSRPSVSILRPSKPHVAHAP
jgi:plastocyanin